MLEANRKLQETVIKNDYCVGCGSCAVAEPETWRIQMNELGAYKPVRLTTSASTGPIGLAESICPFSDESLNEDQHGMALYPDAPYSDRRIGQYREIFVGHAAADQFRERGSSGGLTNWILGQLLEKGEIDAVIGVGQTQGEPGRVLFTYQIAHNVDELRGFSKSKYYPIEVSQVMQQVRANPGRYAFVGVPCFIKAIQNLRAHDPILKERIAYSVAIVCGHLKSTGFAENLAWQMGVTPKELDAFDFRVKMEDKPANNYGVRAFGVRGGERIQATELTKDLFGTDWGIGPFKLKSCDYCDDIAGECADVALGDAWLPEESKDWRGNNILVVRNPVIHGLLQQGLQEGKVKLRSTDVDSFVKSQSANYRHRRDGLAYRLALADKKKLWRPRKRIEPNIDAIPANRRKIMDLRVNMAATSHTAFAEAKRKGSYKVFENRMFFPVVKYYWANGLRKYVIKLLVKKMLGFNRL